MKADIPNEIAALPPWLAGYEMADEDIALLTFNPDGESLQLQSNIVVPLDQVTENFDEVATTIAQNIATNNAGSESVVFIVGHGPNGRDNADRMMQAIYADPSTDSQIIGLHNDGETVSARTLTRPWLSVGPPADVSADMVAQGLPQPAASRAMSDRMWQPDPVPGYPSLSAHERAALNAAPPSKRAEAAVELLEDLATGKAQDVELTQSRLAGLMSSKSQGWVPDHVMMTAVSSDTSAMADELRRLYVAAPPEDQPAIVGPAAIAAYAQHSTTQPLRAIQDHLDEKADSNHFLPLINAVSASGTNAKHFQSSIRNVHQRLLGDGVPAQRDAAWQETRPQGPHSAGTTPPPPGPEDMPPSQGFSGPSMS